MGVNERFQARENSISTFIKITLVEEERRWIISGSE